ncbi:DNA cytosine methyltransferase [Microbacterium testaceum]|uniref:DNA cytosine methyltransferase n=1 Tax=Microbacterium testaceum TaxID=2033 RepID=UPI001D175BEF|nr:DNA cytosine methyltransferase [Microbacterium testaceum]MCC4250760.1 DNA cytosine methyltransferase [Microbacterium testaceum]
MSAQMLAELPVEDIVAAMGYPTSGELFAGVGGLGMAVDEVFGTKPAWFCEFDAAPSKVLAHHFPDVPNFGDVTKVDWSAAPRVRVLAGGFPCQDVSLAGARRGMQDGTRSGLWSEYVKAIDALRPDWVVIENVRGLLSADGEPWHPDLIEADAEVRRIDQLIRMVDRFLHENPARRREGRTPHVVEWRRAAVRLARSRKRAVRVRDRERGLVRRAIDTVLRDLADLGFDAEWVGLPASDIGAPHGRFRVFILAWPAERTLPDPSSLGWGEGRPESAGPSRRPDDELGGADSALTLLPTPTVVMNDGESVESWSARRERVKATGVNGNGMGMPLPIAVQLLPTPQVADATGGHATRSGNRADEKLLPGAAVDAVIGWGPYAAAIARWELVMGRPAPSPVRMDGKGGKARLNPELTEWMMGWPFGWVTASVIGLSRAEQLKACGNGVVTLQAIAALRIMLARPGVPAVEWEVAA